jgi:DNA polymerase-3 subunit alpha
MNHKEGDLVNIVGLTIKVKQTVTRQKQERMAILKLEDLQGAVEVLVFPNTFRQVYKEIQPNSILLVKGRLSLREDEPKIIAQDLISLEKFYKLISAININLSGIRESLFTALKERLTSMPGKTPIYLNIDSPSRSRIKVIVGEEFFVEPSPELIQDVESILGEGRISLVI